MNNGHRGGGKPSGAGACSKKIMVLRRPGWCGVRSEEAELGGVCMVIKAKNHPEIRRESFKAEYYVERRKPNSRKMERIAELCIVKKWAN